ncbi:hypothetical protein MNBD_GAMMA20-405, partial [hydrothermal vent metagenome]
GERLLNTPYISRRKKQHYSPQH